MDLISGIMGMVSTWGTVKNTKSDVAKYKYKKKLFDKDNKRYYKGQWDRLFCPRDYNSVKLLGKFADNNDEWIKMDDSLDNALSSAVFCICSKYDDVEIYYKGEEFPLFQMETRTEKPQEYHTEKEIKYIRITPKIYPEFQKQYRFYQKKGIICY